MPVERLTMTGMTLDQAWPDLFTPAEAQLLSATQDSSLSFKPREQILRSGSANSLLYLSSGFAGCYRCDRLGRRQFVGIQVPGDYLDLAGSFLGRRVVDIEALSPAKVQGTSAGRLQTLQAELPSTDWKLWRIAMIDAAISRHWVFRTGRLNGRARIANFFCEMLLRLYARGLCTLDGFDLPLTQTDLAETCGMTAVHVNRMLGELREEGICTLTQGAVRIVKLPELFQMGQYSWDYLCLDADLDREIQERVTSRRSPAGRALA